MGTSPRLLRVAITCLPRSFWYRGFYGVQRRCTGTCRHCSLEIAGATTIANQPTSKDAGIAIRHSRGRILFYTAGSRKEYQGWGRWIREEIWKPGSNRLLAQPPRRPNQGKQDPGERPEAVVRQPSRRPGAPLGLASLDLVFGEAALAADLITAPKSLQTQQNYGFGIWGAKSMHAY